MTWIDNAKVVQLRIIHVLDRSDVTCPGKQKKENSSASDVIYPEIRYEQDSINHLEEGEILVTVEDKDRQVVVHVQHLGR